MSYTGRDFFRSHYKDIIRIPERELIRIPWFMSFAGFENETSVNSLGAFRFAASVTDVATPKKIGNFSCWLGLGCFTHEEAKILGWGAFSRNLQVMGRTYRFSQFGTVLLSCVGLWPSSEGLSQKDPMFSRLFFWCPKQTTELSTVFFRKWHNRLLFFVPGSGFFGQVESDKALNDV